MFDSEIFTWYQRNCKSRRIEAINERTEENVCAKAAVLRDDTIFGRKSRGGVKQSPREAPTKLALAYLGDVVAAEGIKMVTRPAQRMLSLVFPVAVARGATQISFGVAGGVLILLVQNNT